MNGGINQLVNTYKGNPQPLEAKVQKAQQGQPLGKVPADLEEALALQQIAELRTGAQNQQAMQAGGAQQSVVDKLKQMLGGMQQGQMAQAPQGGLPQMPQGQPVMAARGGSIDQLMSNLGRHYAGGGIIAFSKPTDENNRSLVNDPNTESSQFAQDIAKIPEAFDEMKQRAREEDAVRAAQDRRMEQYKQDKLAAQQKTSLFNYLFGSPTREKEGVTKLTELSKAPLATTAEKPVVASAAPDSEIEKLKRLAAVQGQTGINTNPALKPKPPASSIADLAAAPSPTVGNSNVGGPTKPAVEPTDPLEVLLRKTIMGSMAKDPEEVRRKAIEANKRDMGLDALLKPAQDRAASREAMIKQVQAERQPLWITALQNAGNKPGNVAQVLNQMATGVSTAKQGYSTQDLKFLDELSDLYANIDKAKIEGRYKDVAAGKEAVKDLIAEQRQAEQSGTSLLNTKENVRSREQIAKDAAAARAQSASAQLEERKARRLQEQNQFLTKIQTQHEAMLNKDPEWIRMSKMKGMLDLQMMATQDEAKRDKIADQLSEQQSKMAAYATSKVGGGMAGAANIPPPPPGAVRETVKKS